MKISVFLAVLMLVISQDGLALDIECKFSGEGKTVVFNDLKIDKNYQKEIKQAGAVLDQKINWSEKSLIVINETIDLATIFVINRTDLKATKQIIDKGKQKNKANGFCKVAGLPASAEEGRLDR